MKTFLKVVLLVIAALIAIKLLPLTLAVGCVIGFGLVGLALVGASVLAVLLGVAAVAAVALSPVWVPVLAVVGLVALIRRSGGRASHA